MWILIFVFYYFRGVRPTYLHISHNQTVFRVSPPVRASLSSVSFVPPGCRRRRRLQARRKRQEEIEKLKQEEALRKQQVRPTQRVPHTHTHIKFKAPLNTTQPTPTVFLVVFIGKRKEKARGAHRQGAGNLSIVCPEI